jgi:hypothetical protein
MVTLELADTRHAGRGLRRRIAADGQPETKEAARRDDLLKRRGARLALRSLVGELRRADDAAEQGRTERD